MARINPHINFNGNAEEAFTFYKAAFGGEITDIKRLGDLASEEFPVAPEDVNKIMHIVLTSGDIVLMGNDVPTAMGRTNEHENRSKIVVSADSREEADTIYGVLTEGAAVEFPLGDSPWGSYFGMFRDKYGIEWMIEYVTAEKSS